MENSVKATFRAIDHQAKSVASGITNAEVKRIIEEATHTTIIDTIGIEEKLDGLLKAITERPPQPIYVKSADPIIQTEIVPTASPIINVEAPTVKVEPRNNIVIELHPWWLLVGLLIPTLTMIVDIIMRSRGK